MATGTGKTFTIVNQIYRLMKAGVARRVLFLVDRRALAAQAVRAFNSFDVEPNLKFTKAYEVYSSRFQKEDFGEEDRFDPNVLPQGYLTDPQPGHAFVYVATIQRMAVNILGRQAIFGTGSEEAIEDDADRLDIPIHAFDLIVADECHRGYTSQELSVWRETLDHFDAIKIGLTATPAKHTMAYFTHLAFTYGTDQAVGDGHLLDYDVVKVRSEVRVNGVFLREGDRVEQVDPETGRKRLDTLEDERDFDTTEIERKITAPHSNRLILEELKKYADEHERRYGRFPKTLVFAANDLPHTSHADQLVDTARDVFGRGDAFVTKITGRVDRPLQRIREFRNRPQPMIAVTVDLLTTGVDIPDLEYLVLLRPVKSRILFVQMLGRGTRLGERYPDKSHFTVFDCFDGTLLEYFRDATNETEDLPTGPTRTLHEIVEAIWQNTDTAYNVGCLSEAPPADRQGPLRRGPGGPGRLRPRRRPRPLRQRPAESPARRLHRHHEAPPRRGVPGRPAAPPPPRPHLRPRHRVRGHGVVGAACSGTATARPTSPRTTWPPSRATSRRTRTGSQPSGSCSTAPATGAPPRSASSSRSWPPPASASRSTTSSGPTSCATGRPSWTSSPW